MSVKNNRSVSFVIITLIYILAAWGGIALYRALPYSMWLRLLIADVFATVITFVFSVLLRNASVYDPYWSVQPIVILLAFAFGQELSPIRLMLLFAVCLWGVRLTVNWAYTFKGLEHQDWRYTMLEQTTGIFYPVINFAGIHIVPTLVVYGCVLPAVYMMTATANGNAAAALALLVSIAATVMQGTADVQMHRHRRAGIGGFIRTGLWKYSRHPNYLGEILMWWGVALAAVFSLGWSWYLITGAAANTLLFLCVSIPLADGRQSKKEGFAEYKKQTRMLLPIKKTT